MEKEKHSVYLAGKISKNDWRLKIAGRRFRDYGYDRKIGAVGYTWTDYEVNDEMSITGPFFISCDHGCYHGNNSHGVGLNRFMHDPFGRKDGWFGCCGDGEEPPFTEQEVLNICKLQIDRADIVFAYIDCLDCFGTLAEIGYAHAKEKTIFIVFKNKEIRKQMWFIDRMQQWDQNKISYVWIEDNLLSKIKEEHAHESTEL